MPRHAGKVDVIYIDPPCNTGNEGWAYNDNVNSPLLKEWLGKVVDRDDLERHDKWLCIKWPRLEILRELLSDKGLIFVGIDENELSSLYSIMNEIFGDGNRFENVIWKKRYGRGPIVKFCVNVHEHVLVYAKSKAKLTSIERPLTTSKSEQYYKYEDEKCEKSGPYRRQPLEAAESVEERKNLRYVIRAPDGSQVGPNHQWLWEEDRDNRAHAANEIECLNSNGGWSVQYKQYLNDENGKQRTEKQQSVISADSNCIDGSYTQTGPRSRHRELSADAPEAMRFRIILQEEAWESDLQAALQ